MRFSQIYRKDKPVISFELFPPKTEAGEAKLFAHTVPRMLELSPSFLTCTYGAGGSTRRSTLKIVTHIQQELGVEAVAHLSCLGVSQAQLSAFLDNARNRGIRNIVAIRGDPPREDPSFRPHPDALKYASELTAFIKRAGGFDVAVAGYPEGHPECPDKYLDWQRCRDKAEAGADAIITQLFYDNRDFFEFDDYLRNKLGLTVPVVPGVLPMLSAAQILRICGLCGASVPAPVQRKLTELADDDKAVRRYGVELASEMCAELLARGVPGIHFYTLNRVESTAEIMHNVGLVSDEVLERSTKPDSQSDA